MARKPAEKNEPDFENTLKQLEEIVSRLENNDLSLEEASGRITGRQCISSQKIYSTFSSELINF